MRRIYALLALAIGVAASLSLAAPTPAAGASYPNDLVWLALGDSYSSGEGLRYIDQDANPPGKTCERATGRTLVNDGQGSRAWAAVAYDQVRSDMANSTFQLLACTGAISNEIHAQYEGEWLAGGEPSADLITLSMGGNNLGFADVIKRCIGLSFDNSTGAGTVLNPAIGCDTTEAELKAAIDQLVGTSRIGPDGGQTLRDMYRELAENAINPGGHIVVAGYPNIVEESSRWTLGWLEGNRCSRIRRSDTAMLRSATGYLNEQIANLVAEVDGQYNNVSFHWLDVSQVYENGEGRHGLCTGDPWVNGLTVGIAGPNSGLGPIRYERSFHPNQKGHDATGAATAEIVRLLDWSNLEQSAVPQTPSASGVVEIAADGLAATLGYEHPTLGPTTVNVVRSGGGSAYQRFLPSVTAVVDSTGETVFEWFAQEEYEQFDFWGLSPDDDVESTVDALGHIFFKWNPGRFVGVSVLIPTDDGFDSIGTLTDDFYDSYYYAYVIDVDDDGVFELDQNFQICEPTCAAGIYYSHIWHWTGAAYAGRSDPPTVEAECARVRGVNTQDDQEPSEVVLYQRVLTELGYYTGPLNGNFGEATLTSAIAEINDNGNPQEIESDDRGVTGETFDRLGFSCIPGQSNPQTAAELGLEDGVATIRAYLLAAGSRSYETAWSSLLTSYQQRYGSYESFVNFWERVDNIGIDSTSLVGQTAGNSTAITVEAALRYALRDGTTSREIVHIDVSRVNGELIISDYRFIRQL